MLDYLRLEVRRTLRDVGFVIFGIGMPVLMYLLFTNLGDGSDREWKTAAMVGLAAYGALGAALGTGTGVAEDKTIGWLRQLRVTPMTPREVVLGRALTGSVIVLPAICSVLLAGALVNGVRMSAGAWVAVLVLLWLGALPFTLLGIGNGYRLTAQTTGVVNVACNLGLSIVGGLWFPVEAFPGWLRSLSGFTPSNRFAALGRSATEGALPSLATVGVLVAWLLVFGSYAAASYRRSARTV
ncbi:ABC transporter permease [Streptomyces sp. NPDC058045]|uniref:ABC transporter permease n=1 Tax=Streptomyces sp. NPDC058045 TaxID=3346311 RepID=UPI0036E605EA